MARLQVELEQDVQRRRQELEVELQQPGRLLRDLVAAQDIADVVARTTGIPVQRLMAGERQKLLELENRLGGETSKSWTRNVMEGRLRFGTWSRVRRRDASCFFH